MTQTIVVGLVVAFAVLYVLWRYMPQKWRNPLGKINPKLAQTTGCGSGCSSCDSTPGTGGGSCHSSSPLEAQDSKPIVFHERAGGHKGA
ncbi:hypothetical protein G7047_15690 [Diaphorobacter sp. HDW4A]|uniref:FeoB-associated Cys-rich membrane protein n=1 Tax=Diaphorobacter sp. HDW4A TaxID=2714924 RepID=UPI00140A51A3|nr:FeoB-associated Cys-rich membrane protein [Diaphorobacter sp. HDW4A]QIL78476.1 hypothetical protein G7047_15690 [Diaphorobacter sp. HDW4A]